MNSNDENTKTCPKCNERQDINNLYCFNCGYNFISFNEVGEIKCPNCNQFQNSKNNFCIRCGEELSDSPVILFKCPQCGKEISIDSKFCPFCFHMIKQKECPDCHHKQNENNNICSKCGYDFVNNVSSQKLKQCPQCNEKIIESYNICPKCGHDFTNKEIPKIKPPHVSKLLRFKREKIFLSNYDFNLKTCPKCNSKLLIEDSFCYNCGVDVTHFEQEITVNKPKVSNLLRFKRETIFLSNYGFNLKICPKCNSKLLIDDLFCYNCGEKVSSEESSYQEKQISVNDENTEYETSKEVKRVSKTDYSPEFRIPYVLYLEEIKKNPKKLLSQKIANKYNVDLDKLEQQGISDGFIEMETPLMVAENFKITDIKKILKEHNLKVSGKKDELIERLGENLSQDELNNHFKCEKYLITDEGLEFLNNNNYITYIHKTSDVSQIIFPSEYINIFDEREYSQDEIFASLIEYFNNKFIDELREDKLDNFKNYSNAIATVLKDQGNLQDALIMRFKIFLFDINNYSLDFENANPSEARLKSKDTYKLIDLLMKLKPSAEEIVKLFAFSCEDFPFKRVISDEDSWKYFVEVSQGKDLKEVSKEINQDYS